jgi:hypothetical protein
MGTSTISIAIFNSYFDITRGYVWQSCYKVVWKHVGWCDFFWWKHGVKTLRSNDFGVYPSVYPMSALFFRIWKLQILKTSSSYWYMGVSINGGSPKWIVYNAQFY